MSILTKAFLLFAVMVPTANAVPLEEMIANSKLVYCTGHICKDKFTGETDFIPLDKPPVEGYVIQFTKEYSVDDITKATPAVMEHYRKLYKSKK